MKTNFIHSKLFLFLFFIPALVLMASGNANAQAKESKSAPEKHKYIIHVVKEENGVKTEIDTAFESTDDFNVDAWVDKQEMSQNMVEMKENLDKMTKELTVTIPHISEDAMRGMPDTIIVNGDTVIVNTRIEGLEEANRELRELGESDYFNRQFELKEFPEARIAEGFAFPGCKGLPEMMPFAGLGIPGLESLMPLGNLEQIVIKKKRHGKKIIITFEDNDDDIIIRPRMNDRMYYYDQDHSNRKHVKGRKVIIEKDVNTSGPEGEMNSKVEHYNDGNKEVIIIHKK